MAYMKLFGKKIFMPRKEKKRIKLAQSKRKRAFDNIYIKVNGVSMDNIDLVKYVVRDKQPVEVCINSNGGFL